MLTCSKKLDVRDDASKRGLCFDKLSITLSKAAEGGRVEGLGAFLGEFLPHCALFVPVEFIHYRSQFILRNFKQAGIVL